MPYKIMMTARHGFVAPKGLGLVSLDYRAQELVTAACMSGDQIMLRSFFSEPEFKTITIDGQEIPYLNPKADLHTITASQCCFPSLFRDTPDHLLVEATKAPLEGRKGSARDRGKISNFGIIYLISPKALALQNHEREEVCAGWISEHKRTYATFHAWAQEQAAISSARGWLADTTGRVRWTEEDNSKGAGGSAGRSGVNFLIQGCLTSASQLYTEEGPVTIQALWERQEAGELLPKLYGMTTPPDIPYLPNRLYKVHRTGLKRCVRIQTTRQEIICSTTHPFYAAISKDRGVLESSIGWNPAADLKVGSEGGLTQIATPKRFARPWSSSAQKALQRVFLHDSTVPQLLHAFRLAGPYPFSKYQFHAVVHPSIVNEAKELLLSLGQHVLKGKGGRVRYPRCPKCSSQSSQVEGSLHTCLDCGMQYQVTRIPNTLWHMTEWEDNGHHLRIRSNLIGQYLEKHGFPPTVAFPSNLYAINPTTHCRNKLEKIIEVWIALKTGLSVDHASLRDIPLYDRRIISSLLPALDYVGIPYSQYQTEDFLAGVSRPVTVLRLLPLLPYGPQSISAINWETITKKEDYPCVLVTYDIEFVDTDPKLDRSYIANGFITHNSCASMTKLAQILFRKVWEARGADPRVQLWIPVHDEILMAAPGLVTLNSEKSRYVNDVFYPVYDPDPELLSWANLLKEQMEKAEALILNKNLNAKSLDAIAQRVHQVYGGRRGDLVYDIYRWVDSCQADGPYHGMVSASYAPYWAH